MATRSDTPLAPAVDDGFFLIAKQGSTTDHLQLSEKEQTALKLHDQLQRLYLRNAILQASRTVGRVDTSLEPTDTQLEQARNDLLQAKAAYALRTQIIEDVLVADPALKAVHAGQNASLAERELLPRITRRDVLSIAHTNISKGIQAAKDAQTSTEIQAFEVEQTNKELATQLMALASQIKPQEKEEGQDPRTRAKIEELQEEVKVQLSRYRIMKGVVSAVIAGSGIDWARDEELRELVLDAEFDRAI